MPVTLRNNIASNGVNHGKGGDVLNASNSNNNHEVRPHTNAANIIRLNQVFTASNQPESPQVQKTITSLNLSKHVEGGYFVVTDISPQSMPSPYPPHALSPRTMSITSAFHDGTVSPTRLLSTTIFYYLTPNRPTGSFHKNRSRIIHTLHRGRGRYVLVHEDDGRVETYVVGKNVSAGEKMSWVVEGGVYKASFLLDDEEEEEGSGESQGLLISETVVPGFDYADHEFLEERKLRSMVSEDQAEALKWLVKDH